MNQAAAEHGFQLELSPDILAEALACVETRSQESDSAPTEELPQEDTELDVGLEVELDFELDLAGWEDEEGVEESASDNQEQLEALREELRAAEERLAAFEEGELETRRRLGLLISRLRKSEQLTEQLRTRSSTYQERIIRLEEELDSRAEDLEQQQLEALQERTRLERLHEESLQKQLEKTLKIFFPPLDHLGMAMEHAKVHPEQLREGLEIIWTQFLTALSRLEVERLHFEAGAAFDPSCQEAIEQVETDSVPDHCVLETAQPGYRLGQRLLVPARVRVARTPRMDSAGGPETSTPSSPEPADVNPPPESQSPALDDLD